MLLLSQLLFAQSANKFVFKNEVGLSYANEYYNNAWLYPHQAYFKFESAPKGVFYNRYKKKHLIGIGIDYFRDSVNYDEWEIKHYQRNFYGAHLRYARFFSKGKMQYMAGINLRYQILKRNGFTISNGFNGQTISILDDSYNYIKFNPFIGARFLILKRCFLQAEMGINKGLYLKFEDEFHIRSFSGVNLYPQIGMGYMFGKK